MIKFGATAADAARRLGRSYVAIRRIAREGR
jgi:hypothetical protein